MSITKLQIICSSFFTLLVNVQSTSSQLDSLLTLLSPCYIHFINQNLLPSNNNKLSPSPNTTTTTSYSNHYYYSLSKLFLTKTPLMIHISSKNIISPYYQHFHFNFTLQNQISLPPHLPQHQRRLPPIKFPFTSGCEIRLIPISPRTFNSLQLSVYFKQNPKYVILLEKMMNSRPTASESSDFSTISQSTLKQRVSQQQTATHLYKSLHKIASSTSFFAVRLNSNSIQHPTNTLYIVNLIFGGLLTSSEEHNNDNPIPLLIPIPRSKMQSLKDLLNFWAQNHQNFHLTTVCCQAWEVDVILDELSIRLNFSRLNERNNDDDDDDDAEEDEDEVATVHVWRRHMPNFFLEDNFIHHTTNQFIWLSHAPMYNYFTFVVFANQVQYDNAAPLRPFDLFSWVAIFAAIPFIALTVCLTFTSANPRHHHHHHHHRNCHQRISILTFFISPQPFLFYSPKPKLLIDSYNSSRYYKQSSSYLRTFCSTAISSFIPSIFWTFGLLLDTSEGHVGSKLRSRPRFWLSAWLLSAIVLSYGYKGCILSFMTRINYPLVPRTLRDLDDSDLVILATLPDIKEDLSHIYRYQRYLGQQAKTICARVHVIRFELPDLQVNFSQEKMIQYVATKQVVNLNSSETPPPSPPKAQPFVVFDREKIVRNWIAVLTFFTNYYVIPNDDRLVKDIFTRHPWIAIRNYFIPIFSRTISYYHAAGILDWHEQAHQDKMDTSIIKAFSTSSPQAQFSPYAFFALCQAKKIEGLPQPVPISLGRFLIFVFTFLALSSLATLILFGEIIYTKISTTHDGIIPCHPNNNDIISVKSKDSDESPRSRFLM